MRDFLEVRKNTYYDSVSLMQLTREMKEEPGVTEAVVVMGTEHNKELLRMVGFAGPEIDGAAPGDLIIAVRAADEEHNRKARSKVEEILHRRTGGTEEENFRPATLASALAQYPESNLVLISVPGAYAAREAKTALEAGRHVMLFSDNVPVEEEIELKTMAVERGLLMMGPDCGTAIINGVPLAFANAVPRGQVGIVGASGTGTQEVSSILARLGVGVSQVIGTGGRDLSARVGGRMMLFGLQALAEDPETRCIVLISKPPAPEVTNKILAAASEVKKPVIVHFIGGKQPANGHSTVSFAENLEQAAYLAAGAVGVRAEPADDEISREIVERAARLPAGRRYVRGLFSGGTLCDEAMQVLSLELGPIYSNIPLRPEWKLPDPRKSVRHTAVDLGDDEFTLGRPHPMIDYTTRVERIRQEINDPETALILLDVVLGYGAHKDPAGELIPAIRDAKDVVVVVALCGAPADPQGYENQKKRLSAAGAYVLETNARAALAAAMALKGRG